VLLWRVRVFQLFKVDVPFQSRMARMDMTFTSLQSVSLWSDTQRPFWTDSRRSLNLARACHITVLTRKVANGWKPKRGADHQIKLCRELVTSKDESSRPAQIELALSSLRGCLLDACAPCIGTPRYHSCKIVKVLAKRNESTPRVSFLHSPRVRPVVIGVLGWPGLGEGCRILGFAD
jgi:hypothetical protein